MFYLVTQTLLWLVLSFLLGLLLGWLLWRRGTQTHNGEPMLRTQLADCQAALNACKAQKNPVGDAVAPVAGLTLIADQPADDLKLISGVGPKLERLLNDMGITHFSQIAGFTQAQIAEVNARLDFTGRIEREGWVSQAKILADGGETEFSRRSKNKG